MKVHIKYFASIREAIGLSAETVETEEPTRRAMPGGHDEVVKHPRIVPR